MNEQQPITWDKDIEPAYGALLAALGDVDRILKARADLSERQAFRTAFVRLNGGIEAAVNYLTTVHNRLVDLEELEPPARPLEAVLADIEAEGHRAWTITRYPGGMMRVETALSEPEQPASGADGEAWIAWRTAREEGQVWNHDTSATSADAAPLLEARLAQIRALHAEKAAETAVQLVHLADAPAHETSLSGRVTRDLKAVTCPTCREWSGVAPCATCGKELHRGAGTGRWLDSIGNVRSDTPEPHEHQPSFEPARTADEVDALNEAALAAEERLRVREASESGEEG